MTPRAPRRRCKRSENHRWTRMDTDGHGFRDGNGDGGGEHQGTKTPGTETGQGACLGDFTTGARRARRRGGREKRRQSKAEGGRRNEASGLRVQGSVKMRVSGEKVRHSRHGDQDGFDASNSKGARGEAWMAGRRTNDGRGMSPQATCRGEMNDELAARRLKTREGGVEPRNMLNMRKRREVGMQRHGLGWRATGQVFGWILKHPPSRVTLAAACSTALMQARRPAGS
jgi:hypothetical protein